MIRIEMKPSPSELVYVLNHNTKLISDKLRKDLMRFCKFVQEKVIKPHTPVKTGRLRRSIQVKLDKRTRYKVVIRIYAGAKHPVPYAWIVEEGSPEHAIEPVRGMYLKFPATQGKYAGKPIFVTGVDHPGYDGYKMFFKGYIVLKTHLPRVLMGGIRDLPFKVPRYRL